MHVNLDGREMKQAVTQRTSQLTVPIAEILSGMGLNGFILKKINEN